MDVYYTGDIGKEVATMESNKSAAAKRRWESMTPEQRKARTSAGSTTYRVNAARRRIAKAHEQIANDMKLIEELTSST